ncbi:hypothetical protein [Diaminobutyricimonas sp. TR449]|uniref:hypothetical protein n=1 Tax=Diaminobutyricimonas sp. TR449 TaxID=2708076 RepID=UPI001422DAA1|nr:hypothetical protein [Diaminobutyricimonas sp. TR449]
MFVLTVFLLLLAALAVWGIAASAWQLPRDGYRQIPMHDPTDWTSGASPVIR